MEQTKQKIAGLNNRLKRYRKRTLRFKQNRQFSNNQKAFYRNLEEQKLPEKIPTKSQMETFWNGIWKNKVTHDEESYWLNKEIERCQETAEMLKVNIKEENIKDTLNTSKN